MQEIEQRVKEQQKHSQSRFMKILNIIESIGNRIPHPFMLFIYLSLFVIFLSWIVGSNDVKVVHPGTGEVLPIKSLVSNEGLHYILTSVLENFAGFTPLGLVLAMMLGVGLADKIGLFEIAIKTAFLKVPKPIVTYVVIFTATLANITAAAAYVIVPPLAAMIFKSFGRHPIAGLAAGIAGVGCGYTANLAITGDDALLSGISTEVAQTIVPGIIVTPVDNWFFMVVSVFVLTIVGVFVTEKIIEPRLGTYHDEENSSIQEKISLLEKKALRNSGVSALLYIGFILLILFIPNSPLRNEEGGLLPSLFLEGIIPIIILFFVVTAVTYGVTLKRIRNWGDVAKYMTEAVKDMSGFIVLVFVIAQFIAYLKWSNLATWMAVSGAEFLKQIHLDGFPAVIMFVFITTIVSLLITSGSALWSVLAPIFIPMLMLLNFHPAFIQVAYRIADSSTNMITPLNPYVAIMLGFLIKYDKKAGLGTHISLILPYTIAFLIVWIILLCIFAFLGIPIGPGVDMYLK
ncbi:AbgT family transporter [Ureibacillus sp. GCM10028918]|uniref:AbgT family transporter n=1 Tax=Ureibacillus sp. GCM10028918 TaxID=3273429 RepID=UPI003616E4E4